MSSTRWGGLAERPARWRSLYFMAPSKWGWLTSREKAELTIGPRWAYRKGGIQDDAGGYVVPPNATLCFQMQLVGVRDAKHDDASIQWGKGRG